MWAVAVYDFGISDAEFWELTLLKFDAIARRSNEVERKKDYRVAMVCAAIYEQNRNPKKRAEPYSPSDFMPKEEPTINDLVAKAKSITWMFGGTVKN